ncbi:uncharacterized protein LOC126898586 [Daktulosphaira vitifoliae]|uniref:uncharacterized protein LOC126898586 n=1 Tax=Daktulosphaira vitifoliae TaxID=58002 RepID=UPI0021A9DF03|nr:uncharacterized protein LOC126898586 [Daktulosphaira vitifoliae]
MEQIVKLFVHQSYFIENDLVIDYNFVKEAQTNASSKDWIVLIPKGWTGVDEQVAFKNIIIGCDEINKPIKSIIFEKKCFQNIVKCNKKYQLMYIAQNLEILGRSEYFTFYHQNTACYCVTSTGKSVDEDKTKRLHPQSDRRPIRRQSPTPHDFYKNNSQTSSVIKSDKPKSKRWSSNSCNECKSPNNFNAQESAYLTKIQDLTNEKEALEQHLLKVEKDLVQTLDVVNKQFMLNRAFSQQKENVQRFIDDLVKGLLNDGRITFWANDQEFTVVRENLDKDLECSVGDSDTTALFKSQVSFREACLKAIISQQEQTIRQLVNKIKDSIDIFLKTNDPSSNLNSLLPQTPENQLSSIGYMDSSGTTYFATPYVSSNSIPNVCTFDRNEKNKETIESHETDSKKENKDLSSEIEVR